jgi:hypothetical protein
MGKIDNVSSESEKYKNAQKEWKNIVNGTWPTNAGIVIMGGNPYSFSTNHNKIKGTISYSIKYSDCSSILPGGGAIRRKINKIETQPTTRYLATTFKVIHVNEILQLARGGNVLGSRYKVTSVINGDSTVTMANLVNSTQNITPQGVNYGLSAVFSFNSTTRSLTSNIEAMVLPSL